MTVNETILDNLLNLSRTLSNEQLGIMVNAIQARRNREDFVIDDAIVNCLFLSYFQPRLECLEAIKEARRNAGKKHKGNQHSRKNRDKINFVPFVPNCENDTTTQNTTQPIENEEVWNKNEFVPFVPFVPNNENLENKKEIPPITPKEINKENINNKNTPAKKTFDFRKALLDLNVEPKLVTDWLQVRAKKKATNSETAFKAIVREVQLSGYPANECIRIATENSWMGIKAQWIINAKASEVATPPISSSQEAPPVRKRTIHDEIAEMENAEKLFLERGGNPVKH